MRNWDNSQGDPSQLMTMLTLWVCKVWNYLGYWTSCPLIFACVYTDFVKAHGHFQMESLRFPHRCSQNSMSFEAHIQAFHISFLIFHTILVSPIFYNSYRTTHAIHLMPLICSASLQHAYSFHLHVHAVSYAWLTDTQIQDLVQITPSLWRLLSYSRHNW